MIVVTVDLWPKGNQDRAQRLGVAIIGNDCTGTATQGNYTVKLSKRGGFGLWKTGRIEGFPRKRLLAWDLLFRALASIVGERNR